MLWMIKSSTRFAKRFPTAKIMPDLLVEAQHSTVRIFEVMKAITEKEG